MSADKCPECGSGEIIAGVPHHNPHSIWCLERQLAAERAARDKAETEVRQLRRDLDSAIELRNAMEAERDKAEAIVVRLREAMNVLDWKLQRMPASIYRDEAQIVIRAVLAEKGN